MPDIIRQLNGSRGFLTIIALAAVLVPMWFLVRWANTPAYAPLFQEMEWGEVGAITDQLQGAGIEYRLEKGGSEVQVASADLARARVILAQEGHGVGRPGLELFDKPAWGMTDFTQRVTYRRALEGELARTIGRLRGVERAQVHLALPVPSPLRKMQREAEAAVVISVSSGVGLSPDIVRGISYLVSNSVEQLTSDHVAILDDTGRLLSAPMDQGSPVGLSNRQLEMQASVEARLTDKAEGILSQVLGEGNARVQVSAVLNFEQVDRTVESYDPDGQVVLSEQRSESAPGDPAVAGESSTIFHNTFQNSRSVERSVSAVGEVSRLTVAVLLNEEVLINDAGGDRNVMDARLANLEALMRNAVGFDASRGDQVSIAAIPFEPVEVVDVSELTAETALASDPLALVERFLRPFIALVGILITFLLARRVLRPLLATASQGAIAGQPAMQSASAVVPIQAPDQLSEAQLLRKRMLEEPSLSETAGQVVRAWLAES